MAYTPKNANGQATMANSSPVVVASDQTKIKVDLTDTTANAVAIKVDNSAVTQPISASSLPLPSLAATSTKQSDGSQKTQVVDGGGNVIGATSNALDVNIKSGNPTTIAVTQATASSLNAQIVGNVAAAATDSGNPIKVGAVYKSTQSTYTDGQRADLTVTSRGNLRVSLANGAGTNEVTSEPDNSDGMAASAVSDNLSTIARNTVFNGSTWDRMYGDTTGIAVKQATASNLKMDLSGSAANTTAGLISTKIDQTTPGTTNNVTTRDVTYTKQASASGTLVANTVTTQALTVSGFTAAELEITNISGASTIYYTLDGSTAPTTTGTFSGILPATPSSIVLPCSGTTTVKLISAGTPTWGAVIRGA